MTPFLRQVAGIYASRERDNLIDYCFVLPNKRSATFFAHFLQQELSSEGGIMPDITNISDFVASFSDLTEANRYDRLFTLYDEYRKIPGVEVDFDQFIFWGETLLSDFDDVDRYLVDADALFVNVKRLREISSNYLTDEQLEVIRRYWGEERTRETIDRFWNHIEREGDKKQHKKFVKLWEVLAPLYHAYQKRLQETGLATSGMLYRNAVKCLTPNSDFEPIHKRYIFVGFNVLSTAEIRIFTLLQRMGRADFYWDFNSPAFKLEDSRATRFMKRNIKEFPSRYRLEEDPIETMPKITMLGVPSNIGQVKAAGETLSEWVEKRYINDTENAIDTAVVLPDESLFIPMIHSVPESIGTINVTMGFPMRLSPMANLLHDIVRLQLRSRIRNGEQMYFYEDVKTLLTITSIRNADENGCRKLENIIQQQRLFTIPATLINTTIPALKPIFTPLSQTADTTAIFGYISGLCDFLEGNVASNDDIQLHFINSYRDSANELFDAADRFDITMTQSSFFKLIERAINSDTVRFIGQPLCGLQIMGVLETRALDFKNVIMLSMNERVFPRRHYNTSIIPDALRNGYGMSTIDFQESIFAYYFYRLISRAEHVTLIYDARTVGGSKSNEMSRYLAQLLYLNNDNSITHNIGVYNAQRFTRQPISVKKTPDIIKKLNRFRAGGDKNLSASSLNTYISCPLNFYLQYVEGFNPSDDITDYMDSSTYGSIVHEILQNIYRSFQIQASDRSQTKEPGELPPVTITASMLNSLTRPESVSLDSIITQTINRIFNRLDEQHYDEPLLGEALVLGRVMREAIVAIIKEDIRLCPFTFVGAEYKMAATLEITPEISINIKQIIDRIDIVGNTRRIVDYKTGSDTLRAPSVDALFSADAANHPKAIMQLMLYCHIYNTLRNSDEPIQPIIYKLLTIPSKGLEPLKIGNEPLTDYHQFKDEFMELLTNKISELFDSEIEFTQTDKEHNCTFCKFRTLCGRQE